MKKAFDQALYKKARITDLILFGINSVIESEEDKSSSSPFAIARENKEKCTLERLIKECFTSFHQAFCFSKYPQWPDFLKLDRQLRTLRKRKLITGNPKASFFLTKLGKKIALKTAKSFRQRKLFK